MKKKLILVAMLVSMLSILFMGCDDIIKLNKERDFHQVLSTVQYTSKIDGKSYTQTSTITKGDFTLAYNSSAQMYIQYLQKTAREAGDLVLKNLQDKAMMTMFARSYIIENGVGGVSKSLNPENAKYIELLSKAEQEKAIKAANKQMKEALDSYFKELIKEDAANYVVEETETVEDSSNDKETRKIIFDAKGGSEVATLSVGIYKKVVRPADPTKDGYKFGGWYLKDTSDQANVKAENKVDFKTYKMVKGDKPVVFYAKWYKYTAPRTALPTVEEDEEIDENIETLTTKFNADDAKTIAEWDFDDLIKTVALDPENTKNKTDEEILQAKKSKFETFKSDALAKLKKNFKTSYRNYNFYLEEQYKSQLLTKFENAVKDTVNVDQKEIEDEYQEMIKQNRESFKDSTSNYETALKESLASTIYHPFTGKDAYAFTKNILLKFDDETLKKLTDVVSSGNVNAEEIEKYRNQLAQDMMIKVSNPYFKAEATLDEEELERQSKLDDSKNKLEEYNNLVQFVWNADKKDYEIKFGVKEENNSDEMAYLLTEIPAFSKSIDGKNYVGIVNQIKASMDSVWAAKSADGDKKLTDAKAIYWFREVYNTWLYLVGDDEGGTNTKSNNNGLGYLVSGSGDSTYIKEYTDLSRQLMTQGTGAYNTNSSVDGMYVVGDNFIDEAKTDGAYAGIFMILITEMPYDDSKLFDGGEMPTGDKLGNLPLEKYIFSIEKYEEKVDGKEVVKYSKTVKEAIEAKILQSKQTEEYSKVSNQVLNNKYKAGFSGSVTTDDKLYEKYYDED